MDDEIHDLDDEIHDDLLLASLLVEDGHPDAARRMLDRPHARLRAVRARLETVVANAAVERAAEEAVAGPAPATAPGPDRRAVALRAAMAALVWLAAALVAFDAPSLEILGSESQTPSVTSDRVRFGHAEITPSDRRIEDRRGAERTASPAPPRGPSVADRGVGPSDPQATDRTDPDSGSFDGGDHRFGLGGLVATGDQLDDIVDVPDNLLERIIDAAPREDVDLDGESEAPPPEADESEGSSGADETDGSDEADGDEELEDDGGGGVLPGGDDDRDGSGSSSSLP